MAMEGDSDCVHGINLDYSHCLECEGLIKKNQSFDGYCSTCGQPWQGHVNKLWYWICILSLAGGLIIGSAVGYYATIIMSYRGAL